MSIANECAIREHIASVGQQRELPTLLHENVYQGKEIIGFLSEIYEGSYSKKITSQNALPTKV